jgi:hypothetical protein
MYVKYENYWRDSYITTVNNLSFVISLYRTYGGDKQRTLFEA